MSLMEFLILYYLLKNGPMTVSKLAKTLDVSIGRGSQTISQCLKKNLVIKEKEWKEVTIYPNQNNAIVQEYMKFISTLETQSLSYKPPELVYPPIKLKFLNCLKSSPKNSEQLSNELNCTKRTLFRVLAFFRSKDLNLILSSDKKIKIYSLNPNSPLTKPLIQLLNSIELEPKVKTYKKEPIKIPIPTSDRILIHLLKCSRFEDKFEVSFANTQNGIANVIRISQKHIPRVMKTLINKGYVFEKQSHVEKRKQKYKVYFLTLDGIAYSTQLKNNLENLEIPVKAFNGQISKIKVFEVLNEMGKYISLIDILEYVPKTGVFDCYQIKNEILTKRQKYIDHTDRLPELKYFLGRSKELKEFNNWFESKSYKVLTLRGIAGIGKTTLLTKIVSDYKKKTNVFLYRFHEWSSLKNVLMQLSEFLDKLGKFQIKKYLHAKETIDLNELSILLEEQLKDIKTILIFDDFQKAKEQNIYQFFEMLLTILDGLNTIKVVIAGREIKSFYDRRDVVIREKVKEISLDGLDEESSVKLMERRKLEPHEFKKIYKLTDGHPLSLELIEKVNGIDKANLQRFIQDEILKRLASDEIKLLEVASVFRFPVPVQAYFEILKLSEDVKSVPIGLLGVPGMSPDALEDQITIFKHTVIETLIEKSLMQRSGELYDIHDIIRDFFYKKLDYDSKKQYHLGAAKYYEHYYGNIPDESSIIETMYHFLNGEHYEKTAEHALKDGHNLIKKGFGEELKKILDNISEKYISSISNWMELLLLNGEILEISGNLDRALTYYQEIVARGKNLIDDLPLTIAYRNIGRIYVALGDWNSAKINLETSRDLSKKIEDRRGLTEIYYWLGVVEAQIGNLDLAMVAFNTSLELAEKINFREGVGKAYLGIGNVYKFQGIHDKSVEVYNKSLEIFQNLENKYELRKILHNVGGAYGDIGELNKALEYYAQEKKIAEDIGDIRGSAYALNGCAWVHVRLGNLNIAIQYCEEALSIFKKLRDKYQIAETIETYAHIFWKKYEWDKAIEKFDESIRIFRELGHVGLGIGNAHFDFGLMLKEKGDLEVAKVKFNEALKIFKKLDNKPMIEKIENELKSLK